MFLLRLAAMFGIAAARGPGCNCNDARQGWAQGDSSLSGKLHVASAAECCSRCSTSTGCSTWEYASAAGACWLKDNARAGHPDPSRVSGTCAGGPPAPPTPPPPPPPTPPPPPPPSVVEVAVSFDPAAAAVTEVSAGYASYTMDWWAPSDGARPEGWGPHANVLELDLTSPKLRALTAALGPSYLRIGGSLDKKVVYQMPGTTEPCPAELCLNTSRWDQLHAFCKATDSKLVFGLSYPQAGSDPGHICPNGCSGTSGVWNATQATALFEYSAKQGYTAATTLYGFELGEELTNFKVGTRSFAAYTKSYHTAATLLGSVFGTARGVGVRPKLMGPCPGMSWPQLAVWYPSFLAGTEGALDVAVYHSYNQIQPDPPRVLYLNETIPSGSLATQHGASPGGTGWQGAAMSSFAKVAGVPLWLGEFGPHNGGGGGEYASTFASSFWYLDALGKLAQLNHSVLARQTLVGGNYELLRCSSGQSTGPEPTAGCDFEPHPDYYVALLWRRLMGPIVLQVPGITAHASTQPLRMYAHCTAGTANGSVTVSFSNMDESVTFTVETVALPGPHVEYHLTRANQTLAMQEARQIALNNVTLRSAAAPAFVPALPGKWGTGAVSIAPASLGWVTFPGAMAKACM